jgi:hypothetical protein
MVVNLGWKPGNEAVYKRMANAILRNVAGTQPAEKDESDAGA